MPAGPAPMTATRLPVRADFSNGSGGVDALRLRLQDLVAGVAVAVADRDRLVHLVAAAVILARGGADAAQDARGTGWSA